MILKLSIYIEIETDRLETTSLISMTPKKGISQNRMGYDEIECNRNKDTGNGLPTLNGQSEPFHSELKNSG